MSDSPQYEDSITCPKCGAIFEDRCDYPSQLRHDGDDVLWDCWSCEAACVVSLCVDYTFKTTKAPKCKSCKEHVTSIRTDKQCWDCWRKAQVV